MESLGVVIVNFNTMDLLIDCLNNLLKAGLEPGDVSVVDNASTDDSAQCVDQKFPEVVLIRSENKGLAHGYNLGLKALPDRKYYLFLGTDAFPNKECVEGVKKFLDENTEAGIATAKLILRNGNEDPDTHRGFPTPWTALTHFSGLDRKFPKSKVFNKYFMGWQDFSKTAEVDLCISHFMMVKADVFKKIGLWDEDFFVYGEDVDLCWRAKKAGFKIYYLPQYTCLHYKGVSVGIRKESSDVSRADEGTKKRMKSESTRAMKLFYKKHMYGMYPWIINKIVESGISVLEKVRQ